MNAEKKVVLPTPPVCMPDFHPNVYTISAGLQFPNKREYSDSLGMAPMQFGGRAFSLMLPLNSTCPSKTSVMC